MGEWRTVTLQQLGRIVTGKTPRISDSGNYGGEIPFVTTTDMDGRRIIDVTTGRYLSVKGYESVANALIPARAVMVSCIGSVGKAAISSCPCVTNQQINSIIVESDNNPLFVYYALSKIKDELRGAAGGSVQPILNKSDFGRLQIGLPPPDEQDAIAFVLGTLDDKIELNRRTNEMLESIARALFKDWFVDFGPTRAKAEGQAPYLAQEIWELFPEALDDDDKPVGWKYQQLQRLADVNWGDTKTTKTSYTEEGYTAFSASGPDGFLPYHDFERVGIVLSAIGVNCGLTWLASGKWSCIKNTIRFWSTLESVPTEYLYLATHGKHFWPKRGSVQTFISQTDARNLKVLLPAPEILKHFSALVLPLYDKVDQNRKETNNLAQTRDLLLPKLMSGEIRLCDAEKVVEAVA